MKINAKYIGIGLSSGAIVLLALHGAKAGRQTQNTVDIQGGGTEDWFRVTGALSQARVSSDSLQHLGCGVRYGVTRTGQVSEILSCFAQDASGKHVTCAVQIPGDNTALRDLATAVASINSSSALAFYGVKEGDSYKCTEISVYNSSEALAGLPPPSPCSAVCANPQVATGPQYQAYNLHNGSHCIEVMGNISGGVCGNMSSSRELTVNGVPVTCNTSNWSTVPPIRNGGYCLNLRSYGSDASTAYIRTW